jgi:hypothetical protein
VRWVSYGCAEPDSKALTLRTKFYEGNLLPLVNNSTMKYSLTALLPLALLLALTGCGGSGTATESATVGGVSSTRGTAASADPIEPTANPVAAPFTAVGLFLTGTDAPTPTWEHLWATVYKVEGIGADDKPVTLFTSGEGFLMDLTQPGILPGAGVAAATLPHLTRLRLTLAPAVQASKREQSTVETIALVPALPKDADGRAVATLTLAKPFVGGSLTLAADLTKFTPVENKAGLELTVADSPKAPLTLTVTGQLRGSTLMLPGGGRLALELAGAQLANADGSSRPKLTEGAAVIAEGTLAPEGKALAVTRLTLGRPETASLEGAPSEADPKLGTFVLTLTRAQGILPTRLTVSANLAEKASLRGRGGLPLSREAFLAALGEKATWVRVEGGYEPATGAFAVRRGWLQGKSPREAQATGTLSADEKSGALTLTQPTDWDGFAPTEKGLALSTTAATAYLDEKGAPLTREAFIAALKERTASAVGLLDGDGKLAATKLVLGDAKPKPEPEKKPAEPEKKPTESEKPEKTEKAEKKAEAVPGKKDA